MAALISLVTYACPFETRAGGCSETEFVGSIQATDGSVPFFAA
jgi:hypothetical protein